MRVRSIVSALGSLGCLLAVLLFSDFSSSFELTDLSHIGGDNCTHSEKADAAPCQTSTDPNNTSTCSEGTFEALSDNGDAGKDWAEDPSNACPGNGCSYQPKVIPHEAPPADPNGPIQLTIVCEEQPPADPGGGGGGGGVGGGQIPLEGPQ